MNESIMYNEVYEILQILGNEFIRKIPQELYLYIKDNRDKNETRTIDPLKPMAEQNLLKETIEFISFLNLEYWADEEERKELIKIYSENERKYQEESRIKYNPNIFSKKREIDQIKNDENITALTYKTKENIFIRIIKKFFNIK